MEPDDKRDRNTSFVFYFCETLAARGLEGHFFSFPVYNLWTQAILFHDKM